MKPRHWAEMGESTFVLGIWLLYWVHRLLGRWPFRLCLYPVVLVHWLARPVVRKASLQYLSRVEQATGALGRKPGRGDSLRHMVTFAETMLDKLLAVSGRYRFEQVHTEGREQFYEVVKAGKGGIIVTAHMGCLELCRAMAEKRGEVKLHILVHTRHAEQFNRLLKRLNPDSGFQLVEVTDMGPGTAVALEKYVTEGGFVVIAGDRVPVSASQTVDVDFLGHKAAFPVGPYVLASLFKCPLYLLGCIHENNGYTIHFETLAERVELPRGKRAAALTGHAQHYAERVTALLKRSPFDWFNFFPFWDQANASARNQE
ncbi:acyltransferase [Myxococcus sp. CA051A]|uniref:Acyltransferase n=1 Tax=Myxococcus llanfairpwllgwyngyllgogerychwyrndrobwllllantysiliogogogochensis TaxID=2590453 RepID=A0A540X886_9BACT|nr:MULTISPECIES: acyltransferase [Myxococcus]NTX14020.1 acyltransferase [Myxococcus sp. CA056]NTX35593.1 acyltransferase [Myxococcus sp. CA033]NTX62002.1 acyltransferase [Myxococcus sp. CA051A]TQF17430.1 acyltransferase [Myxococcus llanfairpwllgwyngyllgogerychwyrndrobwllllantysiliogogogochensis]